MISRSWNCTPLNSRQVSKAVIAAREIAVRLQNCDQVEAAVKLATQQTNFPNSVRLPASWDIAQGYAGLSVMYSYLDTCFPEEHWDILGHQYLERSARMAEKETQLAPGLFTGLSGLAFATLCLSRQGKRYQKMLSTIEATLLPNIGVLIDSISHEKSGILVSHFDVISGLSGIGAYLLSRLEEPAAAETLRKLLLYLVGLTQEEIEIPSWHTPAAYILDEEVRSYYPDGNLNCGLAHGIPGPLAILSLSRLYNVPVEGVVGAIKRVANWLMQNRLDDDWGINWPTAVPLKTSITSEVPFGPSRTAWCYGSPGIARSLWLAGEALDDNNYRELAIEAMKSVYRRPVKVRRIDSPTFCHGVAGLLQITLRFAHDTKLPVFAEATEKLVEQLLSLYEPDSLLGYRCLEPGNRRVDKPWLLDGAAGVALVLLSAAIEEEPNWDRLFLLS